MCVHIMRVSIVLYKESKITKLSNMKKMKKCEKGVGFVFESFNEPLKQAVRGNRSPGKKVCYNKYLIIQLGKDALTVMITKISTCDTHVEVSTIFDAVNDVKSASFAFFL